MLASNLPTLSQVVDMPECTGTCPYVGRIAKLETQQDHIVPMINKMDNKLDTVLLGLGRVEILELKHANNSESISRAFNRIDSVEVQIETTTKVLNDLLSQIKGMTRLAIVFWACTGASIIYIINKVIL